MNYQGDFLEDATVYIPFNTFDSNDPSASVTITNLAQGDVEIWKDGVVQTTPGDGVTLSLNIGTGNGAHLIAVDTSSATDGWFVTGADYHVRITGTTIDGATVNAWVGSFSIENRFKEVNVTAMTAGVIANATFNADVGSTGHTTNIIALAARKILEELQLDTLVGIDTGVAVDGDLSPHVITGSVLAHIMAANKNVTTSYNCSTDSLEAIKVHADTIKSETVLIVADTGELQGDDIPGKIATLDTVVDGVETKVDTAITDIAAVKSETASIQTETTALDTLTKAAGDGDLAAILNDTGTGGVLVSATAITAIWAKAMSDLAQGAPSATASVLTAINYLFEAWRNKTTTTATLITVMKDDGSTGLVKSTIADNATTFTKDEFISGA